MSSFHARVRTFGLGVAAVLSFMMFSAHLASAATPEQRQYCTPDVFRLCSSDIPNVAAITACMRKQKANLSPACKAVFDK